MLSNQQFERTQRLALSLAGIELFERHRELLGRRSRRLGILDSAGLDLLLAAAEDGDQEAARRLICLLTTKFTGFFRHPGHFDIAAQNALCAASSRGSARLWSAAAATGEEPYSLAMALIRAFHCDSPPVEIIATDLDTEALAVASRAEYPEAAVKALDAARRERFFHMPNVAGRWSLVSSVRKLVEFRQLNLSARVWPLNGPFDVIFCRNVLMYLEARCRCAALENIASLLAPEGLLILDPTEHLGRADHLFVSRGNGVYALKCLSFLPRDMPSNCSLSRSKN
jgi:chemotaxis protein methyltransferase CheR